MSLIENGSDILIDLFTSHQTNPENSHLKQDSIARIPQTFKMITETNVQAYVLFLRQWVEVQMDASHVCNFADQFNQLVVWTLNNGKISFLENYFDLLLILLQNDMEQVRAKGLDILRLMNAGNVSTSVIVQLVSDLLDDYSQIYGCHSALVIISQYQEYFEQNILGLLDHENHFQTHISKKWILHAFLSVAEADLKQPLIRYFLQLIDKRYLNQKDQTLHTSFIQVKIRFLVQLMKKYSASTNEIYSHISSFYEERTIRTRLTLLQNSEYLLELLGVANHQIHITFILNMVRSGEPELSKVAIAKLNLIFSKMTNAQVSQTLDWLLLSLNSDELLECISQCLIDLLADHQQLHLENKVAYFMNKQQEIYQLQFLLSFSKHQKARRLYTNQMQVIHKILRNRNWRMRLECLKVVDHMLQVHGFNETNTLLIYQLIFDKVDAIRQKSIQIFAKTSKDSATLERILKMMLERRTQNDYKQRMAILQFIRVCFKEIKASKCLEFCRNVVEIYIKDRTDNVKDKARLIYEWFS